MSTDQRYRNCFYYFRGQAVKDAPKAEIHERQFEDNSTKALVNVLEHADLAHDFLRALVPRISEPTPGADPEFFLQGGPKHARAATRHMLGISLLGEVERTSWAGVGHRGRIDGAIYWPGGLLMLVETKVVERLDGAQLNRHAVDWNVPQAVTDARGVQLPAEWTLITWGDIYRWARDLGDKHGSNSVPGFLLDQLVNYLELTGLAPFAGFRNEHFAYFAVPASDRQKAEHYETRAQIRARLAGVWEAVKERDENLFTRLSPIRVNNLRATDSQASAQTNADQKGAVNLTIEISGDDLQLNLVGWTDTPGARFERYFRGPGGDKALGSLLGYELVIWSRNAIRTHAGKPHWQGAPATPYRSEMASAVRGHADEVFDEFRQDHDSRWKKPGYHLRRSWLRTQVAGRRDSFVDELVEEIRRLTPIMVQINGAGQ